MAKLNYERDVKPELKKANANFETATGKTYTIRNNASGTWQLEDNGVVIIDGTLREVYSYLLGMNHAFNI